MEWQLIMIELLAALMVLFCVAFAFVSVLWLWRVLCGDLIKYRMGMKKGRKWEDEEEIMEEDKENEK